MGKTNCHIVLISLFFGSLDVNSLQCPDANCKTGTCNSTGACICNLPDPSTILDGERPFLGGEFCDEEMSMCDGTDDFWCEHGGTCVEIVQGENYTCKCPSGFSGKHCEFSGAPCGLSFCFHQSDCVRSAEGGHLCSECPSEWHGRTDCSIPTKTPTGSSTNSQTQIAQENNSNNLKIWVVLGIPTLVAAIVAGALYWEKLFGKKERHAGQFQQLPVHMLAVETFDDGERLNDPRQN